MIDLNLSSIRFNSCQISLEDWQLIEVRGSDRETFFQAQATNDLNQISIKEGQVSARLNRTGKVQSFFIIGKLEDKLLLLCPKILTVKILEDFNKYIVMDDVKLLPIESKVVIHFNYFLSNKKSYLFTFNLFGLNAALYDEELNDIPPANMEELDEIRSLNGFPQWGVDLDDSMFINDSFLNEIAISYKKGCFLGQETVAKIENNRGSACYPVILKLNKSINLKAKDFLIENKKAGHIFYQKENLLVASLFRDFRVLGKKLALTVEHEEVEAEVQSLPYFKKQQPHEIAEELYHQGVNLFQNEKSDLAMSFMQKSIAFAPSYSDAYESIGVILGRQGRYQEAIEWMDKLLNVKSDSVMAHTNKSLFLMKIGKIEEAEAEKSLATVKSFAMFGEEAKLKKMIEAEKKKKEEDILRREKMFLQVLELDSDDTVALYGLGDIAFYREQFKDAILKLERVVALNEKYSTAYLLLGKSLEASGNLERAQQVYKKGIEIASRNGDMMPANEMQSRLNQLIMASRLA